MIVAAHLAKPDDMGSPVRASYEVSARKGSPAALEMLARADACPESLTYLRSWAYTLHGRSGVGMQGYAPLTYGTIADWSRLMGIDPLPHEVDALMQLDAILCNPPEMTDESKDSKSKGRH